MTHYVLQSAANPALFLKLETRRNVRETRPVMAPWLDQAIRFPSSFEAADYATKNLAPDTWAMRTVVDGELLPLPKKERVHA